jgi:predicted RNA-binding Zn-ribbon protein involved in translation (DUF1610 family)
MPDKRWLRATLFDDLGFRMTFEVDKVLYEQQTEHQPPDCGTHYRFLLRCEKCRGVCRADAAVARCR